MSPHYTCKSIQQRQCRAAALPHCRALMSFSMFLFVVLHTNDVWLQNRLPLDDALYDATFWWHEYGNRRFKKNLIKILSFLLEF